MKIEIKVNDCLVDEHLNVCFLSLFWDSEHTTIVTEKYLINRKTYRLHFFHSREMQHVSKQKLIITCTVPS